MFLNRPSVSLATCGLLQVDPAQQSREFLRRDLAPALLAAIAERHRVRALLQPLGPYREPATVPIQNFDAIPPTAGEAAACGRPTPPARRSTWRVARERRVSLSSSRCARILCQTRTKGTLRTLVGRASSPSVCRAESFIYRLLARYFCAPHFAHSPAGCRDLSRFQW